MIAPTCLVCPSPVQRARPGERPKVRGVRIVDGVQWRWFCSRRCSGSLNGTTKRASFQKAVATWRQMTQERRLQRLRDACQPFVDAQGKVPVEAMVGVLANEIRIAYSRGVTAATDRLRRVS